MKKFLFYVLTLWIVLWIQVLCNRLVGGSWFAADVTLIFVLYFGLTRGPMVGQLMGFGWGILTDASSLGLMGLHGLLYAAAGYLAGMLRRQLDETKAWTQAIFSFGVSFFYVILLVGMERVFAGGDRPLSWRFAAQPVLNAFVAPLCFWLITRWAEAWSIYPTEH